MLIIPKSVLPALESGFDPCSSPAGVSVTAGISGVPVGSQHGTAHGKPPPPPPPPISSPRRLPPAPPAPSAEVPLPPPRLRAHPANQTGPCPARPPLPRPPATAAWHESP
ncbi:unnamed protein product [Closterium sp. NIES-53]